MANTIFSKKLQKIRQRAAAKVEHRRLTKLYETEAEKRFAHRRPKQCFVCNELTHEVGLFVRREETNVWVCAVCRPVAEMDADIQARFFMIRERNWEQERWVPAPVDSRIGYDPEAVAQLKAMRAWNSLPLGERPIPHRDPSDTQR